MAARFGRRSGDELLLDATTPQLVRGEFFSLSFLSLLRCKSAHQLYQSEELKSPKKFSLKVAVVAKRNGERKPTAFQVFKFHVFKFSSFRFRRKETFSSFRSNGKGPGLFSPREYSALFSELFVRAHARRRHRAVFRLTRKGTFENGNLLSLKAENGIYEFPKVKRRRNSWLCSLYAEVQSTHVFSSSRRRSLSGSDVAAREEQRQDQRRCRRDAIAACHRRERRESIGYTDLGRFSAH